jgi:hypothetical protein
VSAAPAERGGSIAVYVVMNLLPAAEDHRRVLAVLTYLRR